MLRPKYRVTLTWEIDSKTAVTFEHIATSDNYDDAIAHAIQGAVKRFGTETRHGQPIFWKVANVIGLEDN
jgi:hypothetical protein